MYRFCKREIDFVSQIDNPRESGMLLAQDKSIEHAWRYFELHAKQRMTVFNFFLGATGLLAAGIATAIQGGRSLNFVGIVLGLLLSFIAFIFWKLDQRVCVLVKRAEAVIAVLEQSFLDSSSHLFIDESAFFLNDAHTSNGWNRLWTYGRAFRTTFCVAGVFGISASLFCFYKLWC